MSSYTKTAKEAGDHFLAILAEYQDMVLSYYATSAACAGGMFPASRESLAMLREASEASFDYWEHLLARQKAFVNAVLPKSASETASVSHTPHEPATSEKPAAKQASSAGSSSKTRSSASARSTRRSSSS